MQVRFHRLALAEYRSAIRHYLQTDEDVAIRFISAVENAAARIEENPNIGSPWDDVHFWLQVKKFKYVIYYRKVSDSLVIILAVAHGSRRPGYWLRRARRA
jgi:plasmid stabilization system protein ParE